MRSASVSSTRAGATACPDGMRNGRTLNPKRKRTNHSFYGPGYPITHPGVFPHHNTEGTEDWTVEKWLKFDYRAKWGSDEFEQAVHAARVRAAGSACVPAHQALPTSATAAVATPPGTR